MLLSDCVVVDVVVVVVVVVDTIRYVVVAFIYFILFGADISALIII